MPLLKQFRHKSFFVRAGAGIKTPQDSKGRRVGTPGHSSTSLTWIRGILADENAVNPSDMIWLIANKDSSAAEAGAISAQEQVNPDGVKTERGKAATVLQSKMGMTVFGRFCFPIRASSSSSKPQSASRSALRPPATSYQQRPSGGRG
jgi:NMT1/THI5 like